MSQKETETDFEYLGEATFTVLKRSIPPTFLWACDRCICIARAFVFTFSHLANVFFFPK